MRQYDFVRERPFFAFRHFLFIILIFSTRFALPFVVVVIAGHGSFKIYYFFRNQSRNALQPIHAQMTTKDKNSKNFQFAWQALSKQ
jgi:hypothetical protein